MTEFEPDATTLGLLQAEHHNGVWVGRELLPIANRIRNLGGSEDDYRRWVLASSLWLSYTGSTGDSATDQRKHLGGAWDKSEEQKPFDLEEALSDLGDRIATGRWTGRSGSRNRAVALAFVEFCWERNCFTRTISSYELAKHTAGMSPKTVQRGLADLVEMKLLTKVDRTDRRTNKRSTTRYQINLYWKPERLRGAPGSAHANHTSDSRSTSKYSLSHVRDSTRDIWSSKGLGQTAGRVYAVLADEPATVTELTALAGLSDSSTRHALAKLADHCLAGIKPERPMRYFKVETPLDLIEDSIGCTGYVERAYEKVALRQEANKQGYPSNYSVKESAEDGR